MKVTLLATAAGPQGVARPGTVLNVSDSDGKELLKERAAREYNHELDRKNPQGFVKAPENFQS